MRVITLSTVKTFLGLTTTEHDAAITAALPFVDMKVKQICRNKFSSLFYAETTSGSTTVKVYKNSNGNISRMIPEYFEAGELIEGTGIPSGAYIEDVQYVDGSTELTISSAATASGDLVTIYTGFNIAYQPLVAKFVQWHLDSIGTSLPGRTVASRSMGPLSVSYSDKDNEIDGRYGVPGWLVKGLPRYMGGH